MAQVFQTFTCKCPGCGGTRPVKRKGASGRAAFVCRACGAPVKATAHPLWRFRYYDAAAHRRMGTGYPSKPETEKLALHVQAQQNAIGSGYVPAPKSAAKHAARPFADVTGEYCQWGESQGGHGGHAWSQWHAAKRRAMLKWWGERLGLTTLADIAGSLPRVESELRKLQAQGHAGKTKGMKVHAGVKPQTQGYAGKTLANKADALRSFARWCVQRGYLADDPYAALAPFDTAPQTIRRAMNADEIRRLLDAAPEHRRMLYEVALCSGLRANELRSLTVSDLDAERGGLRLHDEWTKNRRPGFQPLPAGLVTRLQAFAASGAVAKLYASRAGRMRAKHPADALLYVPHHTARDMQHDLEAAKIKALGPGGIVDFHALRVCFVSRVIEAGATVKEAQVLARHSTPSLTMNTYARASGNRLAELAESVGFGVLAGPERHTEDIRLAACGESISLTNELRRDVKGFDPPCLHHTRERFCPGGCERQDPRRTEHGQGGAGSCPA